MTASRGTVIPILLFFSCRVVSNSLEIPWTVAHQAPLTMGFPRQEYWSGLPYPPPGDLPNPWIEPRASALQAVKVTLNCSSLKCSSLVAQRLKHLPPMRETLVQSLGWEDPLEKETAPHSSTLAWKNPWTEEPGRLQSMGFAKSQTGLSDFTFTFTLGIAGEGSWGGANWDEIRQ